MRVYKGVAALSDFRKKKLLRQLQTIEPSVTNISAEFIHFVDSEQETSQGTDQILRSLLTYDTPYRGSRSGELFLVVPRPGTISPWSSKATDIAQNSGLQSVRRIERGTLYYVASEKPLERRAAGALLHDRMTESVLEGLDQADTMFATTTPRQLVTIDVLKKGAEALKSANTDLGMALADDEIEYLVDAYEKMGRDPSDAELMMFAQVNSEHCRHKVFNADWKINGTKQPKSLFQMIRNTYEKGGQDVLSAYKDNAAVLRGPKSDSFYPDPKTGAYTTDTEPAHIVIKVETHNHPTAIAPFPGAATGSGGEIRDEAATGRGARSKMGLSGFSVSNLNIPDLPQPWEKDHGRPGRITSAFDIMLDAPLGSSGFVNEFGRANLAGYFRTYEQADADGQVWGYHKPIMIAGGTGNIRDVNVKKTKLPIGAKLIVLGGPAMLIGLGGGSGSSMSSGESKEDLDFASVQRGSAEMQRRAQEVINRLVNLGSENPILMIHDVGAGGWSNALPELVHDSGRGATFELRDLPNADPGMSPMEIWCNESQERYVLGIAPESLEEFTSVCERERCPFAVVGEATEKEHITLTDRHFKNKPVDLPMSVLFGKPPKMTRQFTRKDTVQPEFDDTAIDVKEAVERVLHLPAVGSKKFLITIGDRTVGGLTARDQMVGPWQVPVSDVAVTSSSFGSRTGEAMAMGERSPVAIIDAPASGRMAIGEAVTNIAAANVSKLSDIKLSANWMAAVGFDRQDEKLFDTVTAVGEEFCPELGITIPVGKDSLSMRTKWEQDGQQRSVVGPLSLVITAFAPVHDVKRTLTPQLDLEADTELWFFDLGRTSGGKPLGSSALAQVYNQIGDDAPDADPEAIKEFFEDLSALKQTGKVLAYHDRSDGGLLTTLLEMAFASRSGLDIDLKELPDSPIEALFNEELGVVIQVRKSDAEELNNLIDVSPQRIGTPTKDQDIVIRNGEQEIYRNNRAQLEQWWAETSYHMQSARDNADCARQEFETISDDKDPGLKPVVTFKASRSKFADKPKVAILREQGVNGQVEMAAAFDRAGFTSVDIHLNDLASGRVSLEDFVGLAACGGFSYGDVLGAGEGWAKSALFNDSLRSRLEDFFGRQDTFSLGVCNGCQMLATLKDLIPGAENWPRFLKNKSERFEARLVLTRINESPSIFFKDMAGSLLPVPVAHGEGRVSFARDKQAEQALSAGLVPLQYADNRHQTAEQYPANPNGSPLGITSLTTPDGRATIMMPHPERVFLTQQLSWHPDDWGAESPWLRMFQNARRWVG
jgi:phosphoribosylformylglycinamidine synthase